MPFVTFDIRGVERSIDEPEALELSQRLALRQNPAALDTSAVIREQATTTEIPREPESWIALDDEQLEELLAVLREPSPHPESDAVAALRHTIVAALFD